MMSQHQDEVASDGLASVDVDAIVPGVRLSEAFSALSNLFWAFSSSCFFLRDASSRRSSETFECQRLGEFYLEADELTFRHLRLDGLGGGNT